MLHYTRGGWQICRLRIIYDSSYSRKKVFLFVHTYSINDWVHNPFGFLSISSCDITCLHSKPNERKERKQLEKYIYVMRSRKISMKSNMWHFQSFLLDWSAQSAHLERYILLKMHLNWTSGSKVMSNWRILKTIKNKRNLFLFLAISHNQWPPTSNWFRQIATYLWPDQVEWVKCWHWSTISFRYAT